MFNPKDYQARMLICSMYDNILSVKAPFINDLFSMVISDIERYEKNLYLFEVEGVNEKFINEITSKYLERMTKDSIRISYRIFIKHLLIVTDVECINNLYGLYVFVYAMTNYIIKKGYANEILNDSIVESYFDKINIEECSKNEKRIKIVEDFVLHFPVIMEKNSKNASLFDILLHYILDNPNNIKYYKMFYPRAQKSVFQFFKENEKLHDPTYALQIYDGMSAIDNIDIFEYAKIMVGFVPHYYGFNAADGFMDFFIRNLDKFKKIQIDEILKIYNLNDQCTHRGRHNSDMDKINKYILNNNS